MGSKTLVRIAPWDSCIPDMACAAVCPEVFELDEKAGRAVIRREYRLGGPGEGEVPGELAACVEAAAGVCPLRIIKVGRAGG